MARNSPNFLPDICRVQPVLLLILLSETLALITILLRYGISPFPWTQLALTSLFYLWCVLGSAAIICNLRPFFAKLPLAITALIAYGIVLLVVLIASLVGHRIITGHWAIDGTSIATQMVIAALLGGIAVRYAYIGYQLHLRERGELSAKLDALQARMRPHFLFNSLNSVASLVGNQDPRAEQAVEDLANLLRASLDSRERLTTWAAEKSLSEDYLRLEGLRLGERLNVTWRDNVPQDTPMLPLLLQPLLENAVIHGIAPLEEGGEIRIEADSDGTHVRLMVANPIADSPSQSGNQLALDNCRRRLEALYGDTAKLVIQQHASQFRAELNFPATAAL